MIGKKFIYDNVRLSDGRHTILFDYQIITEEQTFQLTETLRLPFSLPDNPTTDRVLRALHLGLGISYYKAFIPPIIDHAYCMDSHEAEFWNNVFINGLGEFLYNNNLNSKLLAKFSEQKGSVIPENDDSINWLNTALLGIGGGKDSIVAGEILKEMGVPITGFVLATGSNRGQAQAVADTMGIEMLGIERLLDRQILEMNKLEGTYNGHVPISLIFALIGCLVAIVKESKYVIVANEASASIPQVKHNESDVNHQWSKSLEFEKEFQDFVHLNISKNLNYFSVIRPLTSVAIAKIFSNYPKYFEIFTSDNSVFKIASEPREHPRWSSDSPKSLSSYILLSPWMKDADLDKTFGRNFLDSIDLSDMFLGLLGASDKPVLDCVGTPSELRLCLSILVEQDRFTETHLVKLAVEKELILKFYDLPLQDSMEVSIVHSIPEDIKETLINILRKKLA